MMKTTAKFTQKWLLTVSQGLQTVPKPLKKNNQITALYKSCVESMYLRKGIKKRQVSGQLSLFCTGSYRILPDPTRSKRDQA